MQINLKYSVLNFESSDYSCNIRIIAYVITPWSCKTRWKYFIIGWSICKDCQSMKATNVKFEILRKILRRHRDHRAKKKPGAPRLGTLHKSFPEGLNSNSLVHFNKMSILKWTDLRKIIFSLLVDTVKQRYQIAGRNWMNNCMN